MVCVLVNNILPSDMAKTGSKKLEKYARPTREDCSLYRLAISVPHPLSMLQQESIHLIPDHLWTFRGKHELFCQLYID